LSETVDKNLFWFDGNNYFTPSLLTGCIAGVMRKKLMAEFDTRGEKILQGEYLPEVLREAEKIFACNASGVYEVGEVVW
ncbi:MAG: aminotransferase class IV, partial [Cyclobacteriaceae bacterium]